MVKHPGLIQTSEEIAALALRLRATDIIAVDTEFIRESTFYPQLEIIQVATAEESWLIDAQAFRTAVQSGDRSGLQPFFDVLEDPKILKVLHAAQGDQECFSTAYGLVARPTIDTATAASLAGYGDSPGLATLIKQVMGIEIKKGQARTRWEVRPLSAHQMEYAHVDVEHLVELARKLMEELEKRGRKEWALELSAKWEDQALYNPTPESITERILPPHRVRNVKDYMVLLELVRWRENRVRRLNVPRRWIADDGVLLDLARAKPRELGALGAFRGISKGEIAKSGADILESIRVGLEAEPIELEKAKSGGGSANFEESRAMDLLKVYLGILADRERIVARYVVPTELLLPLLRSRAQTPDDLVQAGILTPIAARMIGAELVAFIKGECALSLDGRGRVQLKSKS